PRRSADQWRRSALCCRPADPEPITTAPGPGDRRIVRRGLDLPIGYPADKSAAPLPGGPWGDDWRPGRTNRDATITTELRMSDLRRDTWRL
ncbi:MAG: hypothetical protein WA988_04440, partial [Candidatus Nanopelagicales bacterium]